MVHQLKDPALSLLWLRFDPWLGNFHGWGQKKKKKNSPKPKTNQPTNQNKVLQEKNNQPNQTNNNNKTTEAWKNSLAWDFPYAMGAAIRKKKKEFSGGSMD